MRVAVHDHDAAGFSATLEHEQRWFIEAPRCVKTNACYSANLLKTAWLIKAASQQTFGDSLKNRPVRNSREQVTGFYERLTKLAQISAVPACQSSLRKA